MITRIIKSNMSIIQTSIFALVVFLISAFLPAKSFANKIKNDSDLSNRDSCPATLVDQQALKNPLALALFDEKSFKFQTLTPDGVAALILARDTIRWNAKLFEGQIRRAKSAYHSALVARLTNSNVFLSGETGGAKSMFVKYMLQHEEPSSVFSIQVHQMTPEQAFVGGVSLKDVHKAEYKVTVTGSLADPKVRVASIDEFDKANPAAHGLLNSLVNEKELPAGTEVIPTNLETLYTTSNATVFEMLQQFIENGLRTTGAPILNRLQFKIHFDNWLPIKDQEILDTRAKRMAQLKLAADQFPAALNDAVFLKPKLVNWDEIRYLAELFFTTSDQLDSRSRELTAEFKRITENLIKDTSESSSVDVAKAMQELGPTVNLSERLREEVSKSIVMSAFIDFLLSPLADDEAVLKQMQNGRQQELCPLSLWRTYFILTTVGPGYTRLRYTAGSGNSGVEIDFDRSSEVTNSIYLATEQDRFSDQFSNAIEDEKKQIGIRIKNAVMESQAWGSGSFELKLIDSYKD